MENQLVEGIKSKGSLFCSTGIKNAYRYEFLRGLGASRKEKTWNKLKKQHDCCCSKVCWRHKANCYKVKGEGNAKWQALCD